MRTHENMYVCVCVHLSAYHNIGVEGREQCVRICSLLPLCGSQGLNSGHEAWWQVPLPSEPSPRPKMALFKISSLGHVRWYTPVIPVEAGG